MLVLDVLGPFFLFLLGSCSYAGVKVVEDGFHDNEPKNHEGEPQKPVIESGREPEGKLLVSNCTGPWNSHPSCHIKMEVRGAGAEERHFASRKC